MTKHKILAWTAVILWMAVIFYLSSQVSEASNRISTGITEEIARSVENVSPKSSLDIVHFNTIIRKNAHFFVFLVLGILVVNALKVSNMFSTRAFLMTVLICILYAVSDEVHQIFVEGRTPRVTDVVIDSAGAVVGIGLYVVVSRIVRGGKEA